MIFRPHARAGTTARRLVLFAWVVFVFAGWFAHPSRTLPTPLGVLRALGDLVRRDGLPAALSVSYATNLTALALSALVSLPLAYAAAVPALRPAPALVAKLRFLGSTGLPLVCTMLFATGHAVKVAMLAFWMTVFLVTGLVAAVDAVPVARLDHARTLGMGPWRTLLEVVALGTLDQAVDLLRQNAAVGWMMLTMVEGLVRSEGGVGVLLLNQNRYLRLDAVLAIQLVILGVGLVQDAALALLREAVCPWVAARSS